MPYQNQRSAHKASPGASDADDLSLKIHLRAERESPDAALVVARFIERRYGLTPARAKLIGDLAFAAGSRQ